MSTMRQRPVIFGAIAVILLLWLILPIFDVQGTLRTVITVVFWVAFLGLLVLLFQMRNDPGPRVRSPRAGLCAVPLQRPAGRALLAADPPVCGPRVAGCRDPQAPEPGVDGRLRHRPEGLLDGCRGGPGWGPAADLLRVVSKLHPVPARQQRGRAGSPGSSCSASWLSVSAWCSASWSGSRLSLGAFMNMSFLLAGFRVDQPGACSPWPSG